MENAFDDFKECHLLLDSCRGIYIPRDFADSINRSLIKDLEQFTDDLETCKNTDHEWYWEAWTNILDNMQINLNNDGIFFNLYQDGDLFAVIYKD